MVHKSPTVYFPSLWRESHLTTSSQPSQGALVFPSSQTPQLCFDLTPFCRETSPGRASFHFCFRAQLSITSCRAFLWPERGPGPPSFPFPQCLLPLKHHNFLNSVYLSTLHHHPSASQCGLNTRTHSVCILCLAKPWPWNQHHHHHLLHHFHHLTILIIEPHNSPTRHCWHFQLDS